MQIAQIVVKTRTKKEEIFDYAIPPDLLPQIEQGVLVTVPFGNRKIEGIIIGLKRQSTQIKLKPILRVIDPNPVIDDYHLKLARWMSEHYLVSLGQTLFESVVPPAIRSINSKKILNPVQKNLRKSKKLLLISDFSSRLNFYLLAIKKNLAKNRSTIILLPDLSLANFFMPYLKNYVFLHSGLGTTERWALWDKIRRGETKIVIGSQSALFAPVQNLGLVIIDQEENETYKNDRSPRFNAVDVAETLGKLTGADLILGTLTPRIETYYQGTQGKYKILKKSPPKFNQAAIVNMVSERFIISNPLEAKLEEVLSYNKKALLVLNRKGEGTRFSCPDCGWIALCEKCGLPLVPQKSENVCYHCEKEYLPPEACPKCRGIRLKATGIGTGRLKKFLSDLFPQGKIIQIEKETDMGQLNSSWDIAIATSYALKFPLSGLQLVAVLDADQSLNFPDFSTLFRTFSVFYKFLRLGKDKLIQTHLPESKFIHHLAKLDYQSFFLEELASRQKNFFPPFAKIIKVEYRHQDLKKCQAEVQKVYLELTKFKELKLSLPYQPFIRQIRKNHRFQIVIRPKQAITGDFKLFLKSLSHPWIVDVDPIDLL